MPKRYYDTAVSLSPGRGTRASYQDPGKRETLYRDASLRQIDHGALPGLSFQLRVVKDKDPETGGAYDSDGDRAMDRLEIHGAEVRVDGTSVYVTGFMPVGDPWADDFADTYTPVEATQFPFAHIKAQEKRERRMAKDAEGKLTDRQLDILVALKAWADEGHTRPGAGDWFSLYSEKEVKPEPIMDGELPGVGTVTHEELMALTGKAEGNNDGYLMFGGQGGGRQIRWIPEIGRGGYEYSFALGATGEAVVKAEIAKRVRA